MQPKYTHTKSNLIKLTEEAKRKSRQRLIGSIILLGVALFILLNVTAKVKPITINPDVVTIKNTAASNPATTLSVKNNASASVINASQPLAVAPPLATSAASQVSAKVASAPVTDFKAEVVNHNPAPLTNATPPKSASSLPSKKIKTKPRPNPEDILNGLVDNLPSKAAAPNSYIQFAALKNQDTATAIQQKLLSSGINAHVQQITTANGILYRLRAGPFTRLDASNKLQQLKNAGYNGIVTGS